MTSAFKRSSTTPQNMTPLEQVALDRTKRRKTCEGDDSDRDTHPSMPSLCSANDSSDDDGFWNEVEATFFSPEEEPASQEDMDRVAFMFPQAKMASSQSDSLPKPNLPIKTYKHQTSEDDTTIASADDTTSDDTSDDTMPMPAASCLQL